MILTLAIAFGSIAAVNELRAVHVVIRNWDKEEAEALGLAFHLGALTFRKYLQLPSLPSSSAIP